MHKSFVDIQKENPKCVKTFQNRNINTSLRKSGKWFDLECKNMKQSLNSTRKRHQSALKNLSIKKISTLRNDHFNIRRRYKKLSKKDIKVLWS